MSDELLANKGIFTGADILSLPEPESSTATKTFDIAGRAWTFTISKDINNHAETFFDSITNMTDATDKKAKPEVFILPNLKKITVKPGIYLGFLKNFAACLIAPKLSLTELAIFGHKIGGTAMLPIFQWVNQELGNSADIEGEISETKNDLSTEDS
jgi:hypothetical protein